MNSLQLRFYALVLSHLRAAPVGKDPTVLNDTDRLIKDLAVAIERTEVFEKEEIERIERFADRLFDKTRITP